MAEIGEGDDGPPADPQHVLKHALGLARRLQRLAEDDVVESAATDIP